jgi:hypothetical protein
MLIEACKCGIVIDFAPEDTLRGIIDDPLKLVFPPPGLCTRGSQMKTFGKYAFETISTSRRMTSNRHIDRNGLVEATDLTQFESTSTILV